VAKGYLKKFEMSDSKAVEQAAKKYLEENK